MFGIWNKAVNLIWFYNNQMPRFEAIGFSVYHIFPKALFYKVEFIVFMV